MGFPKVLYQRLRRTKGTRAFVTRDYFSLCTLGIACVIGYGIHRSSLFQEFNRDLEEGLYDNSPEFERKKMMLNTGFMGQTSEQLAAAKEREKTYMDAIIRIRDLL